jgi:hypothetical protein
MICNRDVTSQTPYLQQGRIGQQKKSWAASKVFEAITTFDFTSETLGRVVDRVARWVNFGGSCNGKSWYTLRPFGLFLRPLEILCGHLAYFVVIWYIFPHFGIFFSKKNLATLVVDLASDKIRGEFPPA